MKRNNVNIVKMVAFTLCMVMITSPVLSSASLSLEKELGSDRIGQSITPIEKTVIEPKEIPATQDDRSLTLTFQVNPDDITFQEQTIDGISYQRISLQDYPLTTEVGKPQLPQITKLLAIPDQGDPQVEIISSDYTVLSDLNVCPVPQPQILSSSKEQCSTENEFTIDNTVYSANQLYPEKLADLGQGSYLREQRIVRLTINPLQWNPMTKELRVYTTITIRVDYPEKLVCKDVGPYTDICSRVITNYVNPAPVSRSLKTDVIPPAGTVLYPDDPSVPGISADYLIITNDTYYSSQSVYDLACWRANYSGFDVAIISVNDIGGNTDTSIKQFIKHVLNDWTAPHMSDHHVGYILLVGDAPFISSHQYGNALSDRWYGLFYLDTQTGLFVDDGDYNTPEISIGRFSVNNQTELAVIAEKTITYEQNYSYTGDEDTQWHTQILMGTGTCGPSYYDWYWYPDVKEHLLGYAGWNVSEMFYLRDYDVNGDGKLSFDEMIAATHDTIENINEGRSIILYCGHGDTDYWEIFYANEGYVSELNNGEKLPFVMSLACLTGKFDDIEPCMGERLLNTPGKGAVAFWGASSVSSPDSFEYGKYLFTSIFENFTYVIGDILTEGIIQMPHGAFVEYNLFGDPALDLSGSKGRLDKDKPDLTLSHCNIVFDQEPSVGNEAVISTTVHNIGGSSADNVMIRYILVDQVTGEQQILGNTIFAGEIPAGGDRTIEYRWTPQTMGMKSLIVQLDPENTITESCEWNNQAGINFKVFWMNVYVDDDFNETTPGWGINHFNSISQGLNAVVEGGAICVNNGTYTEQFHISKSIALIGENALTTIIRGSRGGFFSPVLVSIDADRVQVSGFTIKDYKEGISVSGDDVIIQDNIIQNITGAGIRLSSSLRTTLVNNHLDSGGILLQGLISMFPPGVETWNTHIMEGNTVQGKPICYYKNIDGTNMEIPADAAQIILANCTNFSIHDRTFSGIVGGVQLGFSSNNTITNNVFLAINGYALIFVTASNNFISENTIQNIGNGITLQYSSDYNTITKNIVTTCAGAGFSLSNSKHNLISENTIQDTGGGIALGYSPENTIIKNTIRACTGDSITLSNSNNNLINNNIVSNAIRNGLSLYASSANTVTCNTLSENMGYGILLMSDNNQIYHNNFIDNAQQASDTGINFWDNGYPSGGNYWDDYAGSDNFHGSNQNIPGGDGIVDTMYPIPAGNSQDLYPLIHRFILGDVNNDRSASYADVDPFVEALGTTQETFQIQHPNWSWLAADCNHDGMITFADIDPFVELLLSPPLSNHPPSVPGLFSPPNHASDVPITTDLSWIGGDPDAGDTVTYDVYFGTTNPPPQIATGQTSSVYNPGTLQYITYYYWRVVAWDSHGVPTMSPIWDFFTEEGPNHPPYEPGNPSPPSNATGVPIGYTVLSWTCYGDPDPLDSVTYDVYFGKTNPPPRVATGLTSTTYHPGTLAWSIHYYWRIVAKDNHGATTSSLLWNFRTETVPPQVK